jgi:hypothetical protein
MAAIHIQNQHYTVLELRFLCHNSLAQGPLDSYKKLLKPITAISSGITTTCHNFFQFLVSVSTFRLILTKKPIKPKSQFTGFKTEHH